MDEVGQPDARPPDLPGERGVRPGGVDGRRFGPGGIPGQAIDGFGGQGD